MAGPVLNFLRRIEKLYVGRPSVPPSGSNHEEDNWENSDIYPGELSLDLSRGTIYTSDGEVLLTLSAEDSVMDGMVLLKSNSATNKLEITSGLARINSRFYVHETSGTDIDLGGNASTDYLLTFVYAYSSNSLYVGVGGTSFSYDTNFGYALS